MHLDPEAIRARLIAYLERSQAPIVTVARAAGLARSDLSTFKAGDRWGAHRLAQLEAALTKLEAAELHQAAPEAPPAPAPAPPAEQGESKWLPPCIALSSWSRAAEDPLVMQQVVEDYLEHKQSTPGALAQRAGLTHQDVSRLRTMGKMTPAKLAHLAAFLQKDLA